MKSDIIIAVGIGFVIGSLFAIGATSLPSLLSQGKKTLPASATPTVPTQPTGISNDAFSLQDPKDNTVADSKSITVSGKAKNGTKLFIETEGESKIIEASGSGTFETSIKINEGANTVYVTNFDDIAEVRLETRTVFYTPEDL